MGISSSQVTAGINIIAVPVVQSAVCTGIGYVAVGALTNINPMFGAVFAGSYCLLSYAINPIFANDESSKASKCLGRLINLVASAAIASGITGVALGVTTVAAAAVAYSAVCILIGLGIELAKELAKPKVPEPSFRLSPPPRLFPSFSSQLSDPETVRTRIQARFTF